VTADAGGNVYTCDQRNNRVVKVTPAGTLSTVGSGLAGPQGVVVDANSNVLIADSSNNRVVMITPAGTQTAVASGFSLPTGVAAYKDGSLYVADHNNGVVSKLYSPLFPRNATTNSLPTAPVFPCASSNPPSGVADT